jgi:hypothetical protein
MQLTIVISEMLNVTMMSVGILNAIMLSIVILIVVAPNDIRFLAK